MSKTNDITIARFENAGKMFDLTIYSAIGANTLQHQYKIPIATFHAICAKLMQYLPLQILCNANTSGAKNAATTAINANVMTPK